MRQPKWFKEALADKGTKILAREITDTDAVTDLRTLVLMRDGGSFSLAIIDDYLTRQCKVWTTRHQVGPALGEDDSGQLDLFPEIPRQLEVAPGRFVDQAWMTRKDWTAAVKQAKTKASNAGNYAESIERVAEKVLPLFADDEQTTADVWKPDESGQASGDA
jgi:hypothetical protein